jgi:hypothetical protein
MLPIFLLKENFKTRSTPIMIRMTLKKSLKNTALNAVSHKMGISF